jgi:hypothetical protein
MDVAIGVDAHKDELAVAAVDGLGRVMAQATFANAPAELQQSPWRRVLDHLLDPAAHREPPPRLPRAEGCEHLSHHVLGGHRIGLAPDEFAVERDRLGGAPDLPHNPSARGIHEHHVEGRDDLVRPHRRIRELPAPYTNEVKRAVASSFPDATISPAESGLAGTRPVVAAATMPGSTI